MLYLFLCESLRVKLGIQQKTIQDNYRNFKMKLWKRWKLSEFRWRGSLWSELSTRELIKHAKAKTMRKVSVGSANWRNKFLKLLFLVRKHHSALWQEKKFSSRLWRRQTANHRLKKQGKKLFSHCFIVVCAVFVSFLYLCLVRSIKTVIFRKKSRLVKTGKFSLRTALLFERCKVKKKLFSTYVLFTSCFPPFSIFSFVHSERLDEAQETSDYFSWKLFLMLRRLIIVISMLFLFPPLFGFQIVFFGIFSCSPKKDFFLEKVITHWCVRV